MTRTTESKARLAQTDIHQQWERDYLNEDVDRFYSEAFARIIRELGDTKGKHLLDLGCGYCFHTVRLAGSDLQITAVDFSEAALKEAKRTIANADLEGRVTLKQADATALPFPDASFDHVMIWGVLMHIPEIEKALSEATRVLKPRGKLVIAENNARSFDVALVEPTINFLRRIIGKRDRKRTKVALGVEEWQASDTGGLLIRKTDMGALKQHCRALGLRLDRRIAGQFTELYVRIPGRPLKRLIHAFNLAWFRYVESPHMALGNILFFVKNH